MKNSSLNRIQTHYRYDANAALLPTELSSRPEAGHFVSS